MATLKSIDYNVAMTFTLNNNNNNIPSQLRREADGTSATTSNSSDAFNVNIL